VNTPEPDPPVRPAFPPADGRRLVETDFAGAEVKAPWLWQSGDQPSAAPHPTAGLTLFLLDHDPAGLDDEYLVEAVVAAPTEAAAVAAVLSLADNREGFGWAVEASRLTVYSLGALARDLPRSTVRYYHGPAFVLAAASGGETDDSGW
jgi:hypothetical protein